MAKAYAAPSELKYTPDYSSDWRKIAKQDEEFVDLLRKWCKDKTDSKNPLVGQIWGYPVADGQAQYMVFRTKPLELIHIPTGDAWHVGDAHIRGLRLSDIKQSFESDKAMSALFASREPYKG